MTLKFKIGDIIECSVGTWGATSHNGTYRYVIVDLDDSARDLGTWYYFVEEEYYPAYLLTILTGKWYFDVKDYRAAYVHEHFKLVGNVNGTQI
jgi:hypothetical protein